MQSGLGQPAASTGRVGVDRRFGRIGVLLGILPAILFLGLALSACVGSGQLANLGETRRTTVALESIEGPPPPVLHKLVASLKEEAGARQIAVVSTGDAAYRLRGYLATHNGDAATISWALDVYDADQHRAFRLSGEERTAGRMWAGADDEVLQRIARAGMTQLAAFVTSTRTAATPASAPPRRPASKLGWLDDWTPEASGIFRIFRKDPAREPEIAADAGTPLPPDQVPLPRSRPAPDAAPAGSALAFAAADER
jgi:hypothetical protein